MDSTAALTAQYWWYLATRLINARVLCPVAGSVTVPIAEHDEVSDDV